MLLSRNRSPVFHNAYMYFTYDDMCVGVFAAGKVSGQKLGRVISPEELYTYTGLLGRSNRTPFRV